MRNFFDTNITNNYINFYSNKFINDVINLKAKENQINNIISINCYVNLINYTLDKNKILITYSIIYKVLYASMPNNITYTFKNKNIKHTEILIPENFIHSIIYEKDIHLELSLIHTNIINFNKDTIKIAGNILISLNIPKAHSVAYLIKLSNYEEYVYTSYIGGKDFTQKTFDIDTHYSNLKFSNKDFILCIIKNNSGIFLRKIFLKNDYFEDIYHNNNLKNFHILDDDNLLLLIHEEKNTLLLKFNLKTLSINLFYKFNNENLFLIKCYKNFFILMQKVNNNTCIISLNKETFFPSKTFGNFAYMDSIDLHIEEILLLLLENNELKLLNLNSKKIMYLNKNLIKGKILNCKFITPKQILLHEKINDKEFLSILNLSSHSKKVILETSFSIENMFIDVKENIIYLSLKEKNKVNIYCIDETETLKDVINIDAININLTCKL